jgi:hypothetical protein
MYDSKMARERTRLIGRFGPGYRIYLEKGTDGKWTAHFRPGAEQPVEFLGWYDSLEEAQEKSVPAANAFLASRSLPVGTPKAIWAETLSSAVAATTRRKRVWQQFSITCRIG